MYRCDGADYICLIEELEDELFNDLLTEFVLGRTHDKLRYLE
jgi:hypothetical protein